MNNTAANVAQKVANFVDTSIKILVKRRNTQKNNANVRTIEVNISTPYP